MNFVKVLMIFILPCGEGKFFPPHIVIYDSNYMLFVILNVVYEAAKKKPDTRKLLKSESYTDLNTFQGRPISGINIRLGLGHRQKSDTGIRSSLLLIL